MTDSEKLSVMRKLNYSIPCYSLHVFLLLSDQIDKSENGEIRTSVTEIMNSLEAKKGFRPVKPPREQIRSAIYKLWEDGIFEFLTNNGGTYCRYQRHDKKWKSCFSLAG